ncbi:hypothetical protein SAMN05216207_105222 [Pseudonocardia ammonioxydans]|uniref:TrbL/VirB6 plasmid conjugal transfer protein n=1 Tax=Pseudonocardia ammonioxydans TaxID=260086 RepID=A0A1I5GXC2_PSUAM|nr:hypothetical protein [Pseudonocardia ammonioxydans]SFO40563.1 hypothetical protein SAMN05216207_105222 [Pseudonocardia ammonioxydans]
MAQSALDDAAQGIWDAGIFLLHGGFTLADDASSIAPSTITGDPGDDPATTAGAADAAGAVDVSSMWGAMVWLAALIALGLFFFQLTSVALRGGRGMLRAVTGPAQFGIALAATTGVVAILLTAADGLTELFLSSLSEQATFAGVAENPTVADRIGENPDLGDSVEDSARSMLLALVALFGIIPAGIGFALQMIFRAAAIMVLIATVPITAACLVADTTASIYWRTVRWILAAVLLKPALALVVLIGVHIMARSEGVAGLLAGAAVLLISLFCPFVLYRLLAFVDPGTGAGMALRSGVGSRGSSSEPGSDNGSSEAMNIARQSEQAYRMGSGGGQSGAAAEGAGGGELGGTTAATGRAGAGAGGASGGAAGASAGAGGGAAAGGALGAAGGAAAAAVVGGYLATKAAGQAAGGFASEQMAQTGIGNPGPAPMAGSSAGQISSSAGAASQSAQSSSSYASIGPYSVGIEQGSGSSGADGGEPPAPPADASGPPEVGRPDDGPTPPEAGEHAPPHPDPAPSDAAGSDGAAPPTTPPGPSRSPSPGPVPPNRPDPQERSPE